MDRSIYYGRSGIQLLIDGVWYATLCFPSINGEFSATSHIAPIADAWQAGASLSKLIPSCSQRVSIRWNKQHPLNRIADMDGVTI